MSDAKSSSSLQPLIDRMRAGDTAARREFLGYVEERVHMLARNILDARWSRMRKVTNSQSLANRTFVRLLTKEQLLTPTVDDFMRYCAWLVDRQLRDIAKRQKRRPGDYGHGIDKDGPDSFSEIQDLGPGPSKPLDGAELLENVDKLPKDLRDIVYLYGYLDLPQSEVAKLLGLSSKEVSRRWNKAKRILNGKSP